MPERSERGPADSSKHHSDNGVAGDQGSPPANRLATSQPVSKPGDAPSPQDARRSDNSSRSFELPPLPPPSSIAGASFSTPVTRVGGVSSILNPVHGEELQAGQRRKASYLDSPASSTQSLPSITGPPQSPASQHAVAGDRPPRRILTPRSPSLHHATSLSQLNPSSGTIDAHTNPFHPSASGRVYTVEPGTSSAPPLPTPPGMIRPSYGFPAPTPPMEGGRRTSLGNVQPTAPSASASPTTSYSSYSQGGQTSPAAQYEPGVLSSGPAGFATAGDGAPQNSMSREHQRQMGIPISSSGGQSVYQMLTLETTSGTVQLPVDVQAASRVADEKRRRNAGASARFRQRRKEKEKEAVTSISRLEQQAKELAEELAFYRHDRDYLLNVLRQIPGGERHFPRPPSPRHRRTSGGAIPAHGAPDVSAYAPGHEAMPHSPEQSRNVRRRTSGYSLPPPGQPTSMPPPPSVATPQGYAPMQSHHLPQNLPPAAGSLPSPHGTGPLPPPPIPRSPSHAAPRPSHQHPHGPPAVLQTLPQPGPYNPYAPQDRRSSGPSAP